MTVNVKHIYRYPVKGMSAEPLDDVSLTPGDSLPHDRRFAIARGDVDLDPDSPKWLPKSNFVMLMRDEKLATLRSRFDPDTGHLSLTRGGKQVVAGDATAALGRMLIDQFLVAYLGDRPGFRARLLDGAAMGEKRDGVGTHRFFDNPERLVSIIGLDSVRDLERVVGRAVDPLRFRANIYVVGAPAWREFDWVGRDITIGGARLAVTERIDRCAATNVDPETAERDMNIPLALRKGFGHVDLGVLARVVGGGAVRVGDALSGIEMTGDAA